LSGIRFLEDSDDIRELVHALPVAQTGTISSEDLPIFGQFFVLAYVIRYEIGLIASGEIPTQLA
jgi:hypothetical protein